MNIKKFQRKGPGKRGLLAAAVCAAAILASAGLFIKNKKAAAVKEISNPAFGETSSLQLKAEAGGTEEEITAGITGKTIRDNEADRVFDAAYEKVCAEILNGNTDAAHITSDLKWVEQTSEGIRVSMKSLTPEYLSDYGTLEEAQIPETGVYMALQIRLTHEDLSRTYRLEMTRQPESGEKDIEAEVNRYLEKEAGDNPEKETLLLPEEINGMAVTFSETTVSPSLPLLFAAAVLPILFLIPKEQEKERLKKRREELARQYPEMLIKMDMLIRAGMSIRTAWQRIASDGMKKSEGKKKKEAIYEEMEKTVVEMRNGVSEQQAYINFGRRTGLESYVRLGNLLSDQIRQGISGLDVRLLSELREALSRRKNEAVKKGEEAGTKLTFPMMLMLIIVMVIIMVPALISI